MKYIEAYELMKDGNAVSRAAWDYVVEGAPSDEKFLLMIRNAAFILCVRYFPNLGWTQYVPLVDDLESDDWYVKDIKWRQPEVEEVKNLTEEPLPAEATVM